MRRWPSVICSSSNGSSNICVTVPIGATEANLCWRELAIVAKALTDGQDMAEIGLMRDIALRTIAVLRDAGRM
ncbi:hypothetical protein [Bradyrhizobium sp. WD16]|uniref:hypothetical protein n=1 Tax=Bradyrhizobium sp. WD16 TaxID=1521768 RepID=UPI0020A2DD3A|nr:hypothetical protein [Bradyrhizobium sp. WD16]